MNDFIEGQRVVIDGGRPHGIVRITTVSKVSKTMITLADGSRWKNGGFKPWGNNDSWYTGPSVRAYKPEDDASLKRSIDLRMIENFRIWASLPDDCLHAVAEILRGNKNPVDEGGSK